MRYAIAAVVIIAGLAAPADAQEDAGASFSGYQQISCRYYVNPKSDPTGDTTDIIPDIRESLYNYFKMRGGFENYSTPCNINALVEAECRLMPKATIGSAVDSLYVKLKSGRSFPTARRCGA